MTDRIGNNFIWRKRVTRDSSRCTLITFGFILSSCLFLIIMMISLMSGMKQESIVCNRKPQRRRQENEWETERHQIQRLEGQTQNGNDKWRRSRDIKVDRSMLSYYASPSRQIQENPCCLFLSFSLWNYRSSLSYYLWQIASQIKSIIMYVQS